MEVVLGRGSYGEVSIRNGRAVKKFGKLSHLIQEYMALRYLNDCLHVVHPKGVDFFNLEMGMELYDCSLKIWLEEFGKDGVNEDLVMLVSRDILRGLVELHDRQLAHGDLKPGNILVMKNPFKVVLGDCGFVSIAKYAKVERTAAIYRDPVVSYDHSHDMFSFGVCFLEMIANIKINRQGSYEELRNIVKNKVENVTYRKILCDLLHSDKSRRPSARLLLSNFFKEKPDKWILPSTGSYSKHSTFSLDDYSRNKYMEASRLHSHFRREDLNRIRKLFKETAFQFQINRPKKGYGAMLYYIETHDIPSEHHHLYCAVTLMILSAVFGKSGFRENNVIDLCKNKYNLHFVFKILKDILHDKRYVSILLRP